MTDDRPKAPRREVARDQRLRAQVGSGPDRGRARPLTIATLRSNTLLATKGARYLRPGTQNIVAAADYRARARRRRPTLGLSGLASAGALVGFGTPSGSHCH